MNVKQAATFALLLLVSVTVNAQHRMRSVEILSPNRLVKLILTSAEGNSSDLKTSVNFKVLYKQKNFYKEIMPPSPLGIKTEEQEFKNALSLVNVSAEKKVHDAYRMVTGKRLQCENFGIERSFLFRNANGKTLNIIFRVYNDGIAFHYEIPAAAGKTVHVISEETSFSIPNNTERWTQPYQSAYEEFYNYSRTGDGQKDQKWGFPALFKANDLPVYFLLSEGGNNKYSCGASLSNSENRNSYKVVYPAPRSDFKQEGVIAPSPWTSPWRTIIVGTLAKLVESTMITDVSSASRVKNTDWILPGAVSWIYWANNHGSKDYQKTVAYTDLAQKMGWPYVLIDWEWDVMANGGDIIDAIKYAKSKGIKPMLWYNSGTTDVNVTPIDRLKTHEQRLKEFKWLNEIGIYGIKVDFFSGDQQDVMTYYLALLKDAADFKLMVNFHGATAPRGWARTYPNLMSMEAVYGAEWYNNKPTLTDKAAKHNTTLPFTRNIVGSMDYTPVTFSNSQYPHITSYGHELALSVVFESGLQHFADRPEAYYTLPEPVQDFLKNVPVAWDETKLVDGLPGVKTIIARRRGTTWYIGGLNGLDEAQILNLDLSFLGAKTATLYVIKDGADDKSFTTETIQIKKGKAVQIKCLPRGGFVGYIKLSRN